MAVVLSEHVPAPNLFLAEANLFRIEIDRGLEKDEPYRGRDEPDLSRHEFRLF